MRLVESIGIEELAKMAESLYDDFVKAVVDVRLRLVVVDAGLHVDGELLLLERGSDQFDLWGINLYPEFFGQESFIEFDSMINLRPGQGTDRGQSTYFNSGSDPVNHRRGRTCLVSKSSGTPMPWRSISTTSLWRRRNRGVAKTSHKGTQVFR